MRAYNQFDTKEKGELTFKVVAIEYCMLSSLLTMAVYRVQRLRGCVVFCQAKVEIQELKNLREFLSSKEIGKLLTTQQN